MGQQRGIADNSAFTVGIPRKVDATDQYTAVPVRTSMGAIFEPAQSIEGYEGFPAADLKGATLRVGNSENSSVLIALDRALVVCRGVVR